MEQLRSRWTSFPLIVKVLVVAGTGLFICSCAFCLLILLIPTDNGEVAETTEEATVEAELPSVTPRSTETSTATDTPTPVDTPTLALSPTPSDTPTITPTPSDTPTSTLTLTPTRTPTATITPSPTRTPTLTLTPDRRSEYEEIDVRDLVINPDAYDGVKIKLRGQVFSISIEGGVTGLQIWVSYPGSSVYDREAVYVLYNDALSGVYEDTYIDVFGEGAGTVTGTNRFGGTIEQPLLFAHFIEIP